MLSSPFSFASQLERLRPSLALGEYLFYRVGAYLLLNVVEDPAWLALAFC